MGRISCVAPMIRYYLMGFNARSREPKKGSPGFLHMRGAEKVGSRKDHNGSEAPCQRPPSLFAPEVHLFQQVAQLLRDLVRRVAGQRRGDQSLGLAQRATLQGQRRGTPVQDGPGRFLGGVTRDEVSGLAFVVEGLAQPNEG